MYLYSYDSGDKTEKMILRISNVVVLQVIRNYKGLVPRFWFRD